MIHLIDPSALLVGAGAYYLGFRAPEPVRLKRAISKAASKTRLPVQNRAGKTAAAAWLGGVAGKGIARATGADESIAAPTTAAAAVGASWVTRKRGPRPWRSLTKAQQAKGISSLTAGLDRATDKNIAAIEARRPGHTPRTWRNPFARTGSSGLARATAAADKARLIAHIKTPDFAYQVQSAADDAGRSTRKFYRSMSDIWEQKPGQDVLPKRGAAPPPKPPKSKAPYVKRKPVPYSEIFTKWVDDLPNRPVSKLDSALDVTKLAHDTAGEAAARTSANIKSAANWAKPKVKSAVKGGGLVGLGELAGMAALHAGGYGFGKTEEVSQALAHMSSRGGDTWASWMGQAPSDERTGRITTGEKISDVVVGAGDFFGGTLFTGAVLDIMDGITGDYKVHKDESSSIELGEVFDRGSDDFALAHRAQLTDNVHWDSHYEPVSFNLINKAGERDIFGRSYGDQTRESLQYMTDIAYAMDRFKDTGMRDASTILTRGERDAILLKATGYVGEIGSSEFDQALVDLIQADSVKMHHRDDGASLSKERLSNVLSHSIMDEREHSDATYDDILSHLIHEKGSLLLDSDGVWKASTSPGGA